MKLEFSKIKKMLAEKAFEELTKFDVKNISSIWVKEKIGYSYFKLGKYQESYDVYKELYEKTNYSRYLMYLGKILNKKGDFNENTENIFITSLALSKSKDENIIYEYLIHLFDSGKLTKKKVNDVYKEGMFKSANANELGNLAAIMLEVDKKKEAKKLLERMYFTGARQRISRHLGLIAFMKELKMGMNQDEMKLYEVNEKIEENKKLFEEDIKSKTISIVGNSPCEKGKQKADKIDSSDLVVRFNNYLDLKDESYAVDYGRKGSIWVRSVGDWVNKRDVSEMDFIVISGLNLTKRSTNWKSFVSLSNSKRILVLPLEYEKELIQYLGSPPSAGISMLYYIYKTKGKVELERSFGFSFTDQLQKDFVNLGGTIAGERHEWDKEKELFEKMVNNEI